MKNKILALVLSVFVLFTGTFSVFADLKVNVNNGSSMVLSWDKDSKSTFYQVLYGEKSVNEWKQTFESELVEKNEIEILWLKSGTKYYFNLVWLDSGWEQVYKSPEIEVVTWKWNNESSTFSVVSTKLIWEKTLKIDFSKKLSQSKIDKIELKIESSANAGDILEIKEIKPVAWEANSIEVELAETPVSGTDYKVLVLVVYDEQWNNIKFWIDSESKFVGWKVESTVSPTDSIKVVETKNENNVFDSLETKNDEPSKLDSAWTDSKNFKTGTTLNPSEVWKNVEAVSEKKENLPKTWPEMFVLLLLALIISGWVIYFMNKNKKA